MPSLLQSLENVRCQSSLTASTCCVLYRLSCQIPPPSRSEKRATPSSHIPTAKGIRNHKFRSQNSPKPANRSSAAPEREVPDTRPSVKDGRSRCREGSSTPRSFPYRSSKLAPANFEPSLPVNLINVTTGKVNESTRAATAKP